MTENHPISPPPELLKQWEEVWFNRRYSRLSFDLLIPEVFQAGADQELEACCEWLVAHSYLNVSELIRAARRPKPPSLKEQALMALSHLLDGAAHSMDTTEPADYIRRALEQLDG